MDVIFACACGERSTCNHSAPSSGLSSMNCPFPVSSLRSSKRLTGCPAPKRKLPGRMFIPLGPWGLLKCGLPFSGSRQARPAADLRGGTTDSSCPERLLAQLPQRRFHHFALLARERGLRRHGVADVVALDDQAGLDAGREIEAGEGLVDAPQPVLERHGLVPAARLAEIVERDALARNDAGAPRDPAETADQHHGGGDVGEAENTRNASPQRFMI